ncbi:SGNH/GDSL hydrolase family protein [Nonlabens xiamenensis]|uniref:hypothetical protein n=1 Tax=Nonlabens xiamenensis TaxID=2341043 RepID=UPI0013DDF364|nr:hypothetical protein [Nonlabens xiamenensis]
MQTGLKFLYFLIIVFAVCDGSRAQQYSDANKVLIDIGDSLTYGAGGNGVSMSTVTQDLLGNQWTVINMGVGGENTLTIAARSGAIPMYVKESLTIPADGSQVEIPSGLYSRFNGEEVFPLKQGSAGINPCYIDQVKCKLSRIEDKYFLQRMDTVATNFTTQPNSDIITSLTQQTCDVATIFIGQNGGYDSPEEFLEQINLFVEHKDDQNIIIITSHGSSTASMIQPIKDRYGRKLIDLKTYMSSQAIYDAIELGLLPDDGSYPTSEDLEMMNNNLAPASLLIDHIHFNQIGYELLGRIRYERGVELGYW